MALTFQQVLNLRIGDTIHHTELRNSDGTPLRARINAKVQLWKTRPGEYRVGIKSGLYSYSELTPSVAHKWCLTADEARAANQEQTK